MQIRPATFWPYLSSDDCSGHRLRIADDRRPYLTIEITTPARQPSRFNLHAGKTFSSLWWRKAGLARDS
jgi:hypothetical protein